MMRFLKWVVVGAWSYRASRTMASIFVVLNWPMSNSWRGRYSLNMLEKLADEFNWTAKSKGYFFRLSYLPMRLMTLLGVDRNTNINLPETVT